MSGRCGAFADRARRARPRRLAAAAIASALGLLVAVAPLRAPLAAAGPCDGPPIATADPLNGVFSRPIGSWQAGDVPHRYPLPDGRVLWVLNDSFVNADAPGGGLTAASTFLHNVALVQQGGCFTVLTGAPDPTAASPSDAARPTSFLATSETPQEWWWFHGGVVVGGELRVVVARMRRSGPPQWGIAFGPASTWIATYDWRTMILRALVPAPDAGVPVYGFSIASDGPWTYLFGQADELRFPAGSTVNTVARVPRGALGARPQYWDGTGWQDDPGRAASVSTNGTWNHRMRVVFSGERWIAVAKEDDFFGADAVVLEAPAPEGPWVISTRIPAPATVAGETVTYDAAPIYAPIGDRLTIVWSNNVLDFALAARDPSLYRPTFTDVALPAPAESNAVCKGQQVGRSPDDPVPGPASTFTALTPSRLVDTRTAAKTAPTGGTVLTIDVARAAGIAPGDLTAAVLNVTATGAAAPGHVTAWPGGAPKPLASNLNVDQAGATAANLVTVAVGADGTVAFASNIATHLVVDLFGVYRAAPVATAAGRFTPLTPARLEDTRAGTGTRPAAGATVLVPVLGQGGVPAAGVAAVALTVTGTQAAADGFVTVWADGPRPPTSSLNLTRGGTRANQVIVPVGADGNVRLFTQQGTHLVVDVAGWYTDDSAPPAEGGRFVAVSPVRLIDSRAAAGRPAGSCVATVVLPSTIGPARGVVVNLTTTDTTRAGYLTAWPTGIDRPTVSNLNADAAGQTRPAHALVALGSDATFRVFQQHGGHLVVDLAGWFT